MSFSAFFSRQARRPTGIFGRFVASRVFEKGNYELNALMYETLCMNENDHVLEIGFGTGILMRTIADNIGKGIIEGIDFSRTMVEMARKKNKTHIKNGKVIIHSGDFNEVPFDDNSFDKVFTVNTVYFWKNPHATVSKIHGMLKPGGKLYIGFHEKSEMEKMPLSKDVFKYYSIDDMKELLSVHGPLEDVDIISRNTRQKTCYCAVGTK